MNIGTKSVSVGSITLNNIKHSKVRSNTKNISSDGYEEIDYNIPSSSINVDKEVKELENIRDILVERKEKLTPRYDNWQSHWDFVFTQDFDHQTIKKYEMMGEQLDSTMQRLQGFNTDQPVRDLREVLAENKVQLEQEEMMRQRMGFINSQLQSNLSEENWNRKLKIEADPHCEFYNQMWLNHLNAQDDSLIKKAKELAPNCSPDDYYFVWASAMCDKNIFDVLDESNDVRDLQLYQTLTDVTQQKEDLIVEKTYLDNEIGMLDANIRQLNQLINEYPYMQIMESDDFKKYAENYQYSDLDKVATIYNSTQLTDKKSLTDKIIDKKLGSYISLDSGFVYLSEQEKILYRYLLETEGQDSVDKFMEAYQDKINQNHGYQLANEFINSLDLDSEGNVKKSLSNSLGVSVEGLDAGIDNFLTGLQNAIINNEELSVDDYKNMIVIQYLNEHSNYEFLYSFSQSFGNMLIPMVVSIAVSAVATPASGAVVSSSLMGISAFGNAKHQALVGGNDLISSTLYGVFVGASEATLGYFLGRIPGISQASGLTFKNLLMEGVEEFSQEWIDAGLRAVILEENVDWSTVPEQSMEAFLMGALMSGFTNGGQAVTNIVINGITYNINVEQTLEYIEANPDVSFMEALKIKNPDMNKLLSSSESEVVSQNHQDITNQLSKYYNSQDSIEVQLSLDSTVEVIDVNILEQILTNNEVFEKFSDYNNNREFFDYKSRDAYIKALQTYKNEISKKGYSLTEDMQQRYDLLVTKFTSFNDIIAGKSTLLVMFGQPNQISVDYMNNTVFNDTSFQSFAESLNSEMSMQKIYEMTYPFYSVYQQIKNANYEIDPIIEERLKFISDYHNYSLNTCRNILAQYSYYGADQNAVRKIALNPSSNKLLYNRMEQIVRQYYPGLSKSKVATLLRSMDTNGICTYATVVNEILIYFNGNEQLFRQHFGFDMYRYENGQKVLNDELILTDLYCFANRYNYDVIHKNRLFYSVAEDDQNQVYLTKQIWGKDYLTLGSWIFSKGIYGSWNTHIIYENGNRGISSFISKDITLKIKESLVMGHTIELDISTDNNQPMDFTLVSPYPEYYSNYTLSGAHSFGHSMFVAGVTESGDLIVSSWGKEYIAKWSELEKVGIMINESYLE